MISLIITILIDYKKNKHIRDKNPRVTRGTRKPDGYGFGQNLNPVMGTGFLMGVNIFHGYGFGIAKPDGFVPVAISNRVAVPGSAGGKDDWLDADLCCQQGGKDSRGDRGLGDNFFLTLFLISRLHK
jgi:hypothetical protein